MNLVEILLEEKSFIDRLEYTLQRLTVEQLRDLSQSIREARPQRNRNSFGSRRSNVGGPEGGAQPESGPVGGEGSGAMGA